MSETGDVFLPLEVCVCVCMHMSCGRVVVRVCLQQGV